MSIRPEAVLASVMERFTGSAALPVPDLEASPAGRGRSPDLASSEDVFQAFGGALPNPLKNDYAVAIAVGHEMHAATNGSGVGLEVWEGWTGKWAGQVTPGWATEKWPTFDGARAGWGLFRERVLRSVDEDTARQLVQMEARETFADVNTDKLHVPETTPNWLRDMNREYALVEGVNGVVRLSPSSGALVEILGFNEFRTFHNGRMKISSGEKGRPKGLGTAWLDHPMARRYREMGMWLVGQEPAGALNLFRGLPAQSSRDTAKGGASGCQHVLDYLRDVISGGDTAVYAYVLDWLAWVAQNPLKKPGVNLVLIGRQGTGKGTLGKMLLDIFGPRYSLHVTHGDHLLGRFSGHLEGVLFLFIDEAMFGRDPRTAGAYKARTTEDTLLVEYKGQTPRTVPNRFAILIASNTWTAAPVELGDRRATILEVPDTRKNDFSYWAALWQEWDTGGREAFIRFLLARDVSAFNPAKPLATAAKASAAEATAGPVTAFWLDRMETGEVPGGAFDEVTGQRQDWRKGPVFVPRADLVAAFRAYAHRERVQHPPTDIEVFKTVRELCPSARETRPTTGTGARVRGFDFPDLDTCRREAKQAMGGA